MPDYSTFINNKTLKMNVGDILKKYDTDGNGSYNQKEIKNAAKNSVSIFAKPFITDKTIANATTYVDGNENGTITKDEISKFLKKYNVKMEDAEKMQLSELLDIIQKQDDAAKKNKKK